MTRQTGKQTTTGSAASRRTRATPVSKAAAPKPAAKPAASNEAPKAADPKPVPKAGVSGVAAPGSTEASEVKAAIRESQDAVERSLKTVADTADRAVAETKQAAASARKAAAETVGNGYDQAAAAAETRVGQALPGTGVLLDQAAETQKQVMDAALAAGETMASALEEIGDTVLACNRQALDDSLEFARKFVDCGSLQDMVELQSWMAKKQFDTLLGEQARFSDAAMKAFGGMAEPLQHQFERAAAAYTGRLHTR